MKLRSKQASLRCVTLRVTPDEYLRIVQYADFFGGASISDALRHAVFKSIGVVRLGHKSEALLELREWRASKRRVFWRVKTPTLATDLIQYSLKGARASAKYWDKTMNTKSTIYRVTVQPKKVTK